MRRRRLHSLDALCAIRARTLKRGKSRYQDSIEESSTRVAQRVRGMACMDDERRSPASWSHVATRPGREHRPEDATRSLDFK